MQFFKRLGSWCYKTNRHFYELHKCCIFKLTCTFIIVLVQIFCNKKFTCPKPSLNTETDFSDESESESDIEKSKNAKKKIKKKSHTSIQMKKKIPKEKKKVSIEDHDIESFIYGNSQLSPSLFPDSSQTSPSFNLKSNMKSTPFKPCQKCHSTESENDQNKSTLHFPPNNCQTNKKMVTEIVVDVHSDPNQDSGFTNDDSFYSC